MPRLSSRSLIGVTCLAAIAASPPAVLATAQTAQRATLTVSPKKVGVGSSVVISGSHLRAGTYLTLLLAIPNARKPLFQRFIGLNKTDSRGSLRTTIRLPLEQYCGPASVYAYNRHTQKLVTAVITLTGCKASGKPGVLPPPPGSKPPKKKTKP